MKNKKMTRLRQKKHALAVAEWSHQDSKLLERKRHTLSCSTIQIKPWHIALGEPSNHYTTQSLITKYIVLSYSINVLSPILKFWSQMENIHL